MKRFLLLAVIGSLILVLAGCGGGWGLPDIDFTQGEAEDLLNMTAGTATGLEPYGDIPDPTLSLTRSSDSGAMLAKAQPYLSLFKDGVRPPSGTWVGPDADGWWTWTGAAGDGTPVVARVRYFASVYRYEYVITASDEAAHPADYDVLTISGFSVFNEDPLLYPTYARTGEIEITGEEFINTVGQGTLGIRLAWQNATLYDLTSVPGYLFEKVLTGSIQLFGTNTEAGITDFQAFGLTTTVTGLGANQPVFNYSGTYHPAPLTPVVDFSGSFNLYVPV